MSTSHLSNGKLCSNQTPKMGVAVGVTLMRLYSVTQTEPDPLIFFL